MNNKICQCGGYWDWVSKGSSNPKPSFIPVGLTDPDFIDNWKWEYICHTDCSEPLKLESILSNSEEFVKEFKVFNLFPGSGSSSSSSCPNCSSSSNNSSSSNSSSSSSCPCGAGAECCGSLNRHGFPSGCTKKSHPCKACGGPADSCDTSSWGDDYLKYGCCGGECCEVGPRDSSANECKQQKIPRPGMMTDWECVGPLYCGGNCP